MLHTAWGSFFVATALYFLINNLGLLVRPNLQDCGSDEFAMMAVPIAILTWVCVIASYVFLMYSTRCHFMNCPNRASCRGRLPLSTSSNVAFIALTTHVLLCVCSQAGP